jgi:hypothetical protein
MHGAEVGGSYALGDNGGGGIGDAMSSLDSGEGDKREAMLLMNMIKLGGCKGSFLK